LQQLHRWRHVQHGFEVVESLAAEVGGDRLGALEVSVEDGNKLGAIARLDRWRVAESHDCACAYKTDAGYRL
jgi:hypothetical protein